MDDPRAGTRRTACGFLGRIGYSDATALQIALRESLRTGEGGETLLLLEHEHVYSVGRNADASDLLLDREEAAARGVEVHESSRGGQVTYHGPGQLVGYPVLDLSPDRRDVRRYIRDLQRVVIGTLEHFGIAAHARAQPEIGVWVGERKIASFGVHLSRWLTTHGFALNVTTDLEYFGGIVACGLTDVEMCSIESETGVSLPLDEVAGVSADHFADVFERRLEPLPDALAGLSRPLEVGG